MHVCVCACARACMSMNGCMCVVHYIHVLLANIQYNFIHNDLLLPTLVTVHSAVCQIATFVKFTWP